MKNFVSLFVMLLVCVGCWIPVASAQDEVTFNDEVLRVVVNTALSNAGIKNHNLPITLDHMRHASFTTLSSAASRWTLEDQLITDLTGLEHATSLTSLTLTGHNISDLTPLKGLTNLSILDLRNNNISDLTPLEGLTNLSILNVSNALSNLNYQDPGDNAIRDLTPLRNLRNLETLSVVANAIRNIPPLGNLTKLTTLAVSNNQIRDISPIRGATMLGMIYLEGNQIRDLSSLEEWNERTRFVAGFGFFGRLTFSSGQATNPLSYPSIYTYLPALIDRYSQLNPRNVRYIKRVPTTLEVVSGDGQTVGVGEALPEPLVVKVLDGNEERFAGVPVTFEVTEGEGTMEPAMAVGLIPTDAFEDAREGEAQTTFTAGTAIGPQTVVATMTHEDTTLQATFTINVQPGAIAAPTISTVDPPPTDQCVRKVGRAFVCRARL